MNPNVPRGAAVLLGYIAELETARNGDAAYQTVIAHMNEKGALPKPITDMTLEELLAEQTRWVRGLKQASGAAGAFQIIRPTLVGLIKQFKVPLSAKFSPGLQDAFGYALLQRRGFDKFMSGALPLKAFGNELAKEWASLPLLSTVRRKVGKTSRTLHRGQSYYDGVAGNKSLDGAMAFEAVLSEALNEGTRTEHVGGGGAGGHATESAPIGDFPVKGAKDDEIVAQVQRRLKELGYTEIGNVDGDFGDFTEKAIVIFRLDAGLPLGGTIDSSLLVALAKAKPREIATARQDATPKEVREAAPEAKTNWLTKVAGFWGMIVTAVGAFINWAVSSIGDIREFTQPFFDILGAIPWWGYAAVFFVGAGWLYVNGRKGLNASVEAVQEGARR